MQESGDTSYDDILGSQLPKSAVVALEEKEPPEKKRRSILSERN